MSMIGQMSFFLGLQISQSSRGIFINQSKYASKFFKKYGMLTSDSIDTPMVEKSKLGEDLQGYPVDATLYRGMIGSLMYLTSSRLDLNLCQSSAFMCRYQATPYRKGLKCDADHAGCQDTRHSTSGSAQFLGELSTACVRRVNNDSRRNINTTQAQQKALDDALVSPADRLEFGKCNIRLKTDIKPKEATFKVVLDALTLTPFYHAFLITTDVPAIYMQEFWATIFVHRSSIRFMINKKKVSLDIDIFRDIL
ncbi:retrovirus-related pol polyprotein from transposon TNT 1-94 [Tanacetum coccineum]